MGKVIARIPLTGGPKGGKTKIKDEIRNFIEKEYGYKVFLVPETATEIIESGFIPYPKSTDNDRIAEQLFTDSNLTFQQMILNLQLVKERNYELAAMMWPTDSVIIYDRAIMDNKGYLMMNFGDNGIFEKMLSEYGLTVADVMKKYDAILSLETSASIIDFNNANDGDQTIRIESGANEALKVDYYVSKAWQEHPNYQRIKATENFDDKIASVLNTIEKTLNGTHVKSIGTITKPN